MIGGGPSGTQTAHRVHTEVLITLTAFLGSCCFGSKLFDS